MPYITLSQQRTIPWGQATLNAQQTTTECGADTPSNSVGDCGTIARLERTAWHEIPARSVPPIDTAPDLRGPSENSTDSSVDLPAHRQTAQRETERERQRDTGSTVVWSTLSVPNWTTPRRRMVAISLVGPVDPLRTGARPSAHANFLSGLNGARDAVQSTRGTTHTRARAYTHRERERETQREGK